MEKIEKHTSFAGIPMDSKMIKAFGSLLYYPKSSLHSFLKEPVNGKSWKCKTDNKARHQRNAQWGGNVAKCFKAISSNN
ncbi:hypothetical protein [Desulfocicer vacuolatum]|uniref:hypothetical protein n=1 Tax=Desulfocicer vacuolatum TaxID=2298 RepID=UPI000A02BEFB|nr:hypothetical protein [Desulfocicer vacuolatum]